VSSDLVNFLLEHHMPLFQNRSVEVSVGVYFDPDHGFLLGFNPKWRGYSFAMKKFQDTDANHEFVALNAFREMVRQDLYKATTKPLFDFKVQNRRSQRTGQATDYRYIGFEIDPNERLQILPQNLGAARRLIYLPVDQFDPADLLTWTTREIRDVLLNQHVSVAVIMRRTSATETEFLMVRYPSYRGYFPIASRVRNSASAALVAREAIINDTGYRIRVNLGDSLVVRDRHHSPRYNCERNFHFELFEVGFQGDLQKAHDELEASLDKIGLLWKWIPQSALDSETFDLSDTVPAIREALKTIAKR
jgi:hypothetical protein